MKVPFPKILLGLCMALSAMAWSQTRAPEFLKVSPELLDAEGHEILLAAVRAADLEEILEESGPFTVFAPSDAAFHRFSNAKMDRLLNAADKSDLKSLLTYHIVAGELSAAQILRAMSRGNGKTSFTTVLGQKLMAHLEGSDIVLTDSLGNRAKITTADLCLDYGVVHEIDRVIMPARM